MTPPTAQRQPTALDRHLEEQDCEDDQRANWISATPATRAAACRTGTPAWWQAPRRNWRSSRAPFSRTTLSAVSMLGISISSSMMSRRHHGVDALERLIEQGARVLNWTGLAARAGRPLALARASLVLVVHALYVAARGLGAEWNGGVDERAFTSWLAAPRQVLLESRRDFEGEAQFTVSQTPVELLVAGRSGSLLEIAGAAKGIRIEAAGRLPSRSNTANVSGRRPARFRSRTRSSEGCGTDHREGQADGVVLQFDSPRGARRPRPGRG